MDISSVNKIWYISFMILVFLTYLTLLSLGLVFVWGLSSKPPGRRNEMCHWMKNARVTSFTKGNALPLQLNCPHSLPQPGGTASAAWYLTKWGRGSLGQENGGQSIQHPSSLSLETCRASKFQRSPFLCVSAVAFSSASYNCFLFLRGSSNVFVYQWYPLLFLSTVIDFNFFPVISRNLG